MIHKRDRAVEATLADLVQQHLRVRPGQRQAGDARDVPALRPSGILVRRRSRGRWVAGVQREVLHRAALDGGGVAGGAIGIPGGCREQRKEQAGAEGPT